MNLYRVLDSLREAHKDLVLYEDEIIERFLIDLSHEIEDSKDLLLKANALDLSLMEIDNPKYDRLKLTDDRIDSIATQMRNVASLDSPIGKKIDERILENGLNIKRVAVPFGVVGVIYEARPNVTFDVFSIAFKTKNACILKGGKDATNTNTESVQLIKKILVKHHLNANVLAILENDHEVTKQLLNAVGKVDLIIPRGGRNLISFVRDNARVPVIETGAGVCHVYIDKFANKKYAQKIITNSKTRRVSVCNALDSIIIHSSRLSDLPYICENLIISKVIIYADEKSYKTLKGCYPKELLKQANPNHYGREFLDYKLSIKTVDSLEDALENISLYSSKHSECIVTDDVNRATIFQQRIDAACVYVNASISFTDGGQFGLGAEIGISTQKLHARGPMGLKALSTYKWLIVGKGNIRK